MNAPEKINWTPELLAECRNEKGVVLGMMSEEARRALIANKDHAETYFRSREWTDIKNVEIWPIDSWHHAYRLSPSYTPPELEPKPYKDDAMPTENENQSAQVSGVPPPTACSTEPIRRSFSREEIIAEANSYMLETWGPCKDSIDTAKWHERLGLLIDFTSSRFPSNPKVRGPRTDKHKRTAP